MSSWVAIIGLAVVLTVVLLRAPETKVVSKTPESHDRRPKEVYVPNPWVQTVSWSKVGFLSGTISGSVTLLPLWSQESTIRNRYDYRTVLGGVLVIIGTRTSLTEDGAAMGVQSLGTTFTVNLYPDVHY